jgi:hypothetical protein
VRPSYTAHSLDCEPLLPCSTLTLPPPPFGSDPPFHCHALPRFIHLLTHALHPESLAFLIMASSCWSRSSFILPCTSATKFVKMVPNFFLT